MTVAVYSFEDWRSGVKPPKGWDCADAVDDGWGKDDLDAFMRATVRPWYPPNDTPLPDPDEYGAMPEYLDQAPPLADYADQAVPLSPAGSVRRNTARPVPSGERPILDPRDPLPSARALMSARYMADDEKALHHHRGVFYEWTGACYREADNDSILARIWDYLDGAKRLGKELEEIPFQPNRSSVENVFAALKAVSNLPAHIEPPTWLADSDMPPAHELLPVKNGLLHLPSGTLYRPSPAYFCLNAADVEFDPGAPKPKEWLRFLDQVWPGDTQSVEALQDMFGYLLSPDTSQQKILLIVGPKRSGKGTIARVLTGIMGQESVAAPTLASLATNFGLAPLIGKSVAMIGDARLSGRADQASIAERLLSISGEDSITVDRKFKPAWTGRLSARFVILTNELPRLADASGALASRFVVLTMEQSFYGREDKGLGNRLMTEMPGILNWAREGYLRLRKRGYFIQPESAMDAIDELEALGSPIAAFLKERCTVAPGHQCPQDRIFEAWRDWCAENGRKEPGTAQSFGRDLRAAVPGLRVSRPRMDGDRVRVYEGIDLTNGAGSTPKSYENW